MYPLPLELPSHSTHPTPLGHHRAGHELPELYSSFPRASYVTQGRVYMSVLLSVKSLPLKLIRALTFH